MVGYSNGMIRIRNIDEPETVIIGPKPVIFANSGGINNINFVTGA